MVLLLRLDCTSYEQGQFKITHLYFNYINFLFIINTKTIFPYLFFTKHAVNACGLSMRTGLSTSAFSCTIYYNIDLTQLHILSIKVCLFQNSFATINGMEVLLYHKKGIRVILVHCCHSWGYTVCAFAIHRYCNIAHPSVKIRAT
jgi:hypothetical protein